MKRRLIVNADDYARALSVSRGVREAHQAGIVTTTTAMMNMPQAQAQVRKALEECPRLGLGVHLNITAGRPLCPPEDVPSLVDKHGLFLDHRELFKGVHRPDPQEILREWEAQIEAFHSTGARLDHLDSHHHIALLNPDIWDIYLSLAARNGCGVRPPLPLDVPLEALTADYGIRRIEFARGPAVRALRSAPIPAPDGFLASFFATRATQDRLLELLSNLDEGIWELMTHPGYAEDLRGTSRYAQERERELAVLSSPVIRKALGSLGIQLATYQDAWSV